MNTKCPKCNIELIPFGPVTDNPLREDPYILHWEWFGRCYECGKTYQYYITYKATDFVFKKED